MTRRHGIVRKQNNRDAAIAALKAWARANGGPDALAEFARIKGRQ